MRCRLPKLPNPRPQKDTALLLISCPDLPLSFLQLSLDTFSKTPPVTHESPEKEPFSPFHFLSPSPFFSSTFVLTKARGSFLSSFRTRGGRLYEKILSRYQKSSIWTLKPVSPCPSASSPRHIRTASRRQARKPTKRLISISPLNSQPDGKASTLLTSTTRERSVLPVKKTIAAVPVSSRNTIQERNTGKA